MPCCVFPSEFPHRLTPDNKPVVKYAQFIDYLCALDPGIQQTYLPFKGRNKVLFHMGAAATTTSNGNHGPRAVDGEDGAGEGGAVRGGAETT